MANQKIARNPVVTETRNRSSPCLSCQGTHRVSKWELGREVQILSASAHLINRCQKWTPSLCDWNHYSESRTLQCSSFAIYLNSPRWPPPPGQLHNLMAAACSPSIRLTGGAGQTGTFTIVPLQNMLIHLFRIEGFKDITVCGWRISTCGDCDHDFWEVICSCLLLRSHWTWCLRFMRHWFN